MIFHGYQKVGHFIESHFIEKTNFDELTKMKKKKMIPIFSNGPKSLTESLIL
jgi:hypothetical protein